MKRAYRLLLTTANIIIYLVIVGLWIAIPEETTLNIWVTGFNLVLTMVILFVYRQYFANFYRSNFFRQFVSGGVSALLILSILGLVNYLTYMNPAQVDVTAQKWNSLSPESEKILNNVKGPLTIHAFGKLAQEKSIRSFLERYRIAKKDLEILFHDVQLRPDMVNKYQIKKDGVIVLNYRGRSEHVNTINELDMAKAMARISRTKDPIVYYFNGLNNLDINEAKGQGGLVLKRALEDSSYKVEEKDILSTSSIPKEVESVIIWGPQIDLSKEQLQVLADYLSHGGTLITALDPNLNQDILPQYREFLRTQGVEVLNNLVIDNHSFVNGSDGVVPLIQKTISDHEIVKEMSFPIFMPLTSSVRSVFAKDEKKATFTSLVSSSVFPHSWAENTPKDYALKKAEFDNGSDISGPVSMAAAVDNKESGSRLIVFGSSTFIHNSYANFTNNFKFFTSSLAWLVDKNNQLVLNLPVFEEKPVFISSPQLGVIFYFSVIFVPLILVGAAIFSYRRRQSV